jgi:hypothetical protein
MQRPKSTLKVQQSGLIIVENPVKKIIPKFYEHRAREGAIKAQGVRGPAASSDAHASSILAEVLGLASIFLPRNRLALLGPYSINSPSAATHFPLCHGFLRPSTPLASPREAAALPDDPRLASCSTRRLVCITGCEPSAIKIDRQLRHRLTGISTPSRLWTLILSMGPIMLFLRRPPKKSSRRKKEVTHG